MGQDNEVGQVTPLVLVLAPVLIALVVLISDSASFLRVADTARAAANNASRYASNELVEEACDQAVESETCEPRNSVCRSAGVDGLYYDGTKLATIEGALTAGSGLVSEILDGTGKGFTVGTVEVAVVDLATDPPTEVVANTQGLGRELAARVTVEVTRRVGTTFFLSETLTVSDTARRVTSDGFQNVGYCA